VANARPPFRGAVPKLPEGFRYRPELIGVSDESALISGCPQRGLMRTMAVSAQMRPNETDT
jgi:hypothetical protein